MCFPRHPMPTRAAMVVLSLATAMLASCHPSPKPPARPRTPEHGIRVIWVTRWDYKTPADIAHVMDNCRRAGFNTVLFQVRGHGTVFYRSRLEPWADELGGRDPGFDPLALACREAHRRGMCLHAWVNVMPGWRGKKPPANSRQLYNARPEWFWRDRAGRRQPPGWYASLNPCYPEVRRYLVDVMKEIVAGYPIDGLHLDYIRFPNEWNNSYPRGVKVPDYPRDRRTLALFRKATGSTPDRSPGRWNAWRTAQVTQLVRDIRMMMHRVRPQAMLSAAVGAAAAKAKSDHFQDARRWLDEDLVDAVFPMNYARDMATFDKRLEAWSSPCWSAAVVTGIMFDNRDPRAVNVQIGRAMRATRHFAAFAYNSLFERLDGAGRPINDGQSANRAALRKWVIPHIQRTASTAAGRDYVYANK